MALVGIELVTHVSEPDALTTRPPPCAVWLFLMVLLLSSSLGKDIDLSLIFLAAFS